MISIRRLDGPFGIEVTGLDLAAGLDRDTMGRVLDSFYDQQFIVVRDQRLSHAQFSAFCEWFGRPKHHLLDHLRLPGFPAILTLSNIFKDGKPTGIYEGASFWHTDVAYEEPPNTSTIAYSILVPERRVALEVASLFLAYDALPEKTKQRIDPLIVLHHYGNRDDMDEDSPYSAERLKDEQKKQIRNVYQPLVHRHPVTGRKALYAIAGSSFGIKGMPDDEAIQLLDELKTHATRPEFVLRHTYQVGDVAGWDTLSTLHKAPLTAPTTADRPDTRLLWRISVTGKNADYTAMRSTESAGKRAYR